MKDEPRFWQRRAFDVVMFCCLQFVVLTVVAMLFYPGGTIQDPTTGSYRFFENFFSDLGLIESHAGQANTISAVLFFVALSLAGVGLVIFGLAFPRFFAGTRSGRILSFTGAVFCVLSGLCFAGVAFTPADLFFDGHVFFVTWAFQLFPVAAILFAVAVFRERGYPNGYGWAFLAFGLLLVLYVALMMAGPSAKEPGGLVIQATGQKTIVYAAIITTLIQAVGAKRTERRQQQAYADRW